MALYVLLVCDPRSARVALSTAMNHKILPRRNNTQINNVHQCINDSQVETWNG